MPFPTRVEGATPLVKKLDALIKGSQTGTETLRTQLKEVRNGTIYTDRKRQLDILDVTFAKREGKGPTHTLKILVGALLFIQMEIAETYKRSYGSWILGHKADNSHLYKFISELDLIKSCLDPATLGTPEENAKAREENMLDALGEFWKFYADKTFVEVDGEKTYYKASANVFNEVFKNAGCETDAQKEVLRDQMQRHMKRYQLTPAMKDGHPLMEPKGKYHKESGPYVVLRHEVLNSIFPQPVKEVEEKAGWFSGFSLFGGKPAEKEVEQPADLVEQLVDQKTTATSSI
jgi:hypothetical protein